MIRDNFVIYWVAVGEPNDKMRTELSPTLYVKKWLNCAIATQKALCACYVFERSKNLFFMIANGLYNVSF